MPISDTDNVILLIMRVGDVDPSTGDPVSPLSPGSTGVVLQNADRLYNKYINRTWLYPAALGSQIFDQYFMIAACQIVIGVLESRVDFSAVGTAMRVMLSQRVKAYQDKLDRFGEKLDSLESQAQAFGIPLMGLIKQIEPITPPVPGQLSSPLSAVGNVNVFVTDASDPVLTGSPYWPTWRRF